MRGHLDASYRALFSCDTVNCSVQGVLILKPTDENLMCDNSIETF